MSQLSEGDADYTWVKITLYSTLIVTVSVHKAVVKKSLRMPIWIVAKVHGPWEIKNSHFL